MVIKIIVIGSMVLICLLIGIYLFLITPPLPDVSDVYQIENLIVEKEITLKRKTVSIKKLSFDAGVLGTTKSFLSIQLINKDIDLDDLIEVDGVTDFSVNENTDEVTIYLDSKNKGHKQFQKFGLSFILVYK
jgi:hypothetical protein